MPDLDGPEVLRHLAANKRYKQLIKVMWSTSRRVKDIEDCKRLGASHYLVKPSDNQELQHMIHQMTAILDFAVRGPK
jgi:CheY-like chemotaxis protein